MAGRLPDRATARRFVVVTHDRWFLDEVCDRTWEVGDGQVHSLRRRLLRIRAGQGRTGQAGGGARPAQAQPAPQGTRLAAARSARADEQAQVPARCRGGADRRRARAEGRRRAVQAGDRAARQDRDRPDRRERRIGDLTLLDHVSWQLGPGDRVGVVGVNGSGKTTLLNVLAGADGEPAGYRRSGEVVTGKTVRLGYLTQEPVPVDPGLRALEAAEQVRSSVTDRARAS